MASGSSLWPANEKQRAEEESKILAKALAEALAPVLEKIMCEVTEKLVAAIRESK